MKTRRRAAISLLFASLLVVTPDLAHAQVTKAGVVTTAEGNVTARRVVLPQPVPLKFKDDVFLQDTITTGDRSLARLLLGGKALVTVRERSMLTVTEVPGRSTVEIDSGKLGLAVARDRMRSGEVIDIKTPNAIVAVRGTVLVVEVRRATAQAIATAGTPTTDVYLLRDAAEVTQLDPLTGAAIGPPFRLGPMQRFTAVGAAPPQVTSFTRAEMSQITGDLQPRGRPHEQAANQEQLKEQLVGTTAALLAAVTGTGPERLAIGPVAEPTSPPPTTPTESPAETPVIPAAQETLASCQQNPGAPGCEPLTTGQQQPTSSQPPTPSPGPSPGTGAEISITGTFTVPTGQTLRSFSGEFSRSETTPLIQVTNATVTQPGPQDLIEVLAGADVALASVLLDITTSRVTAGRSLLRVDGALSGTSPGGLIAVDPSTITSAGDLIRVNPEGTVSTTGPLLGTADTTIVTSPGNLLHVLGGDPGGPLPGQVVAAGTLLSFTRSRLDLDNSLVRLVDGGSLDGLGTGPLVVFSDSAYAGGIAPGSVSGGSLLRLFSQVGRPGSSLLLSGPYLFAADSTFEGRDAPLFNIADGAVVVSTSTQPFASFERSSVTSVSSFFNLETHTQFGPPPGTTPTVGSGDPAVLGLSGTLVHGLDTTFDANGTFLRLRDEVFLAQAGPAPLIELQGSAPGRTRVTASGNFFGMSAATGRPAPVAVLGLPFFEEEPGGTLLAARNATLTNGNPAVNALSFAFVGDGADLATAGSAPLLSFENVALDTAGNVLTVRRSQPGNPSSVALAGPLLVAQNSSFNTTSLGFSGSFGGPPEACCSGFFVGQGAELTSSTPDPLIQLTGSTFNAGPDTQSGGNFLTVADTFTGAPSGELVAPATLGLSGPLLRATDSAISAAFDLLEVRRSAVASATTEPLIQLVGTTGTGTGRTTVTLGGARTDPFAPGTTAFGTVLAVVSGPTSGAPASDASVTLNGPLLSATNSALTTTGDVILVQNGATLSSTTTAPLVQVAASSLAAGTSAFNGDLLDVSGTGGPSGTAFARVSLRGPLLSAGSTLSLTGGLARIFGGGTLVATPSATDPLTSIVGGTHAIATNPGTAIFRLFGRPGATSAETINLPEFETVVVDLGTDRPVQGPGATAFGRTLLEASGASVSGQSVLRVDTALLEATLPALRLRSGSTLTSATDAFDLSLKAKVTSLGPLLTLDASTLNVTNGALIRLANGSFLNITGDLLSLGNGSLLNLANGPVLNVTGNSVARITGALVSFVGTGNQININNNACGGGAECLNFGPVRVAITGGATASNLSINAAGVVKGAGGTINYASSSAAAIVVNGSGSRVVIQGQ